jgi:sRNA-binding protein
MKKNLLIVLFGLGVGYLLGARAGRERYDLIVEKVNGVWEDPRVSRARHEAARYAREQGPVIRERAEAVAKAAPGVIADGAKATAATARGVADRTATLARETAEKTVAAARDARGRTIDAAASVASRAGAARDDLLEDDGLSDEDDRA